MRLLRLTRSSPRLLPVVVGIGMTALGQGLLVALGPLTRAYGTYVTVAGPALIAPDSRWYLANSQPEVALTDMGWTTWGYLGLLRVGHILGDAAAFAVFTQFALAALTGAAIFAFVRRRHGHLAAFAATAALTVNPMTAQWVRFVLTEAIFQPLIVVSLLLAVRCVENATQSLRAALLGVGLFGSILRPNGVLVLAAGLAVLALNISTPRLRLVAVTTTILLTPLLLLASLSATGQPGEATLTEQFYGGVVIEGTEDVRLTILMPEPADSTELSESALVAYVFSHPVATLRLTLTRIVVEVAQVRRHYPHVANLFLGMGITLFLLTAAIGASSKESATLRRATCIFAIPHLILVGVTFAVPEARYGWSGLVALAPLAGVGTSLLVGRALASVRLNRAR